MHIPADVTFEPNHLANRTILISGAGDGIGRSLSIHCAAAGATVILLGRTVAKLEAVYDEIVMAKYAEPAIIPLDLYGATESHYRDMASTIEQEFGQLNGVVHNASILGTLGQFKFIDVEEWEAVMKINVQSHFMMTKALLPLLEISDPASVIFTSSGVGAKARAFWSAYAVSKYATEGMATLLADEYKNSKLRFNVVNPGATNTAMRAKAYPAEDKSLLKTPDDLMPTYLYLLSDHSSTVTGQRFNAQ